MATTYRADWVFTGVGEPIKHGVLIEENGCIVECVPWKGHQVDVDLGQSLIIPGLVNAHTHLDLGALRGKLAPPSCFTDWLMEVIAYRRKANAIEWNVAIQEGIDESIRAGTVFLGDISYNGQSLNDLQGTDLDYVVFREVIALSLQRVELAMMLADDWVGEQADLTSRGLSPHAPYTVSEVLLTQLHACYHHVPMAMHVAESREELQLLTEKTGPFKEFLQNLGVWHPDQLFESIDDVVNMLNDLDQAYLIHGNYLVREQWQRLSPSTTVVYCPRTHAYFGHEPHPYCQMLTDGVSVALGTDSLASNPDLSILNECRFLWQRDRGQLDGATLMKLATNGGKTALLPKGAASFVILPHEGSSDDPWELLWNGTSQPSAVYIRGKQVYPV